MTMLMHNLSLEKKEIAFGKLKENLGSK